MEIHIIHKDKNFLAINKPAGLLVHSIEHQGGGEETLVDWLLKKFPEVKNVGDDKKSRSGIVHRLDKNTSGIMLAPLNQNYFLYLKNLFSEHKIKKTYLAVVCGQMKEKIGKITFPIGLKSGTIKRTIHGGKMKKEAITEYGVQKIFEKNGKKFSLVLVRPLTGRTHQIRVHMLSIGHPVAGDDIYGGKDAKLSASRLMLHALSLEFDVEKGKAIKLEAGPPEDFLGFYENS